MIKTTDQMRVWNSNLGREFTDRYPASVEEMNELYRNMYGCSRSALNEDFIVEIERSIRILEVGSNRGVQLQALQQMGFENLYGIELQSYALEQARQNTCGINLIRGDAFHVPFKDSFFDLVFTSCLLIHISPDDIATALDEIHRCSRRYIWGMEYFAEDYVSVRYRGNDSLLWKANFVQLYLDRFDDLKLIKEKRHTYLQNENRDSMFLLEKIA